jgi:hypothetical protein
MATKYGFKVGQYLLHCDPMPMPMADGRFGAQVVIYSEEGTETVARRFPALEEFATEKEAVEHARAWGHAWVKDNG